MQVNSSIGYDYNFDPKLWPTVFYLLISTCNMLAIIAKFWINVFTVNGPQSHNNHIGVYAISYLQDTKVFYQFLLSK